MNFNEALAKADAQAMQADNAMKVAQADRNAAYEQAQALDRTVKEQLYIKQRWLGKSARLKRLIVGHCFADVRSAGGAWSSNPTPCAKPMKANCDNCGAPVCGTHGRKSTYGRAHSCNEFTEFMKSLEA